MRDEIFDVEFEYNGRQHKATIKADLPAGPEPFGSDYDVYIEGKHKYTLNHCRNEDDFHCWEIKKRPKKDDDPEFPRAIGQAIDKYYK